MRFNWKDTLRRMTGNETACLVCGADGMFVRERNDHDVLPDVRGIPICECPACGARGDFAELVAKASGRLVSDTVRELARIGEVDASAREIDAYLSRKADQTEVAEHMARCVERLRAAPHLCGIRAGLSVSNLRQLPPDTGIHVTRGAPRQFAMLSAPRYTMVPLTMYRYTFDGETSCIDVQNPKTQQREHRIRITGDIGVYLGDFREGEVPLSVICTHNPRTAGQLYGAMRAESSLPPPVIGIAGFPLPSKFSTVKTLYLLDTPDSPLPLAFAMRAISAKTVYGSDNCPDIKVLSPSCAASDITASDVRMLSNGKTHGKSIRQWVAEKVITLADRQEEVANALLQAGASENARAEIVEMLGPGAPKSLVDTIMLPMSEPDDVFTLGNGKMFKSTPVGIYTAFKAHRTFEIVTKSMLCNVGISVDARVVEHGTETACCTITHPDQDVPTVQARIPRSHWNNPDAMAEDIRAAYAECGRTPYVTLYRVGGYGWSDIMQFLGSHCPVQSGIGELGAVQDGHVNFPNFVAFRGTATKQTKAGAISTNAMQAYSEIGHGQYDGYDKALVDILESGVSLERTGIMAGLLHTIFCASGKMFDQSGIRRPPAHMLFVETEPGVWDDTIRALAYIFSGSEYVPLMDYGDRAGFLRKWANLGTLPLVTRLPSADDMATVLSSSPVSVIAVADPLTAMACSGRGTVTFVLPNVETAQLNDITHDEIIAMRNAFAATAIKRAGTGWLDIGQGGAMAVSTPCLSALGVLTEERNADTVAGGLYRSVRGRYPGAGMTGARAFFGVLHRTYTAQQYGDSTGVKITFVAGAPSDVVKASFNDRGEHVFVMPDTVLVSKSVVQLINREKSYLFDAEQLSREFNENGIISRDPANSFGIDERRVWAFPRSVWDSEVVRAAGFKITEEAK